MDYLRPFAGSDSYVGYAKESPESPIPREIKPAPEHCTCHEQGPPFLRARELGWIAGRQRPKPYDHEDVIRLERGTFCKSCTLPVVL